MKTTLNSNMKINLLLPLFMLFPAVPIAFAGEDATEEEIKHEISFLAAKLLEMSGEDSYTVESSARLQPFLGICTSIRQEGVVITCVTPGSQAEKGGLITGDIVVKMNDLDMLNADEMKTKEAYYGVVKAMKIGELIKVQVVREDKTIPLALTVGSVDHPAYNCKISK